MHCPHKTKVGAKLQACQESVSDPSDLIHSLKVKHQSEYSFRGNKLHINFVLTDVWVI